MGTALWSYRCVCVRCTLNAGKSPVNYTEVHVTSCCAISQVDRSFGHLSGVIVYWEADPGSERELLSRSGNITLGVGQTSGNITVIVAQDEIPELDETFTLSLVNVSHGRLGTRTSAALTVLASDDPYGIFVFTNLTRHVRLPEADATVPLTISRQKGLMGQVCADLKAKQLTMILFSARYIRQNKNW